MRKYNRSYSYSDLKLLRNTFMIKLLIKIKITEINQQIPMYLNILFKILIYF
jgi:hypothetical protein